MDGLEDALGAMLSDPEAMNRLKQLASALGGSMGMGGASEAAPRIPTGNFPPPVDSGLTELLGKVLRAYSAPSEAMQLVGSLKPWLQPQRAEKLEKAMRIAHFARAARAVLPELLPGR